MFFTASAFRAPPETIIIIIFQSVHYLVHCQQILFPFRSSTFRGDAKPPRRRHLSASRACPHLDFWLIHPYISAFVLPILRLSSSIPVITSCSEFHFSQCTSGIFFSCCFLNIITIGINKFTKILIRFLYVFVYITSYTSNIYIFNHYFAFR